MAMNKDLLGGAWAEVIINASSEPPTPDMRTKIIEFWTNIADELIQHIKDNANVKTGIGVTIPATSAQGSPSSGSTSETGSIE